MTVAELKQLLSDAPDEMPIMISVEDHLHPGMFAFAHPCPNETGISTLGPGAEGEEGGEVFLILPHGFGVSEKESENGEAEIPELN